MPILSSVGVSAVLMIAGIVLFIILCFRGWHTAIAAIVCGMIVALGSSKGWVESVFTTFPSGMATFIKSSGLMFLSAGLFSFLMRETRSGEALAKKLVTLFGVDKTPLIIALVATSLQLAGISSYTYIVASIAFPLLKESDLPVGVGFAACVGCPPIVAFCMPGVTALPNVLPTTYLGTTLYAAPLLSLACAAVGILLMVIYMRIIIRKARQTGQHYVEPGDNDSGFQIAKKNPFGVFEMPHFINGVVPMISVIGIAAICQLVLGLGGTTSVCIAMWISCVIVVLMNWDVCVHKMKIRRIISTGPMEMAPFIIMVCCVYGFGSVTQDSGCFETLKNLILSIHLNPYITAWLSVALIAALCADGIGGLILWLGMFGDTFASMPTVNTAALHRILVTSATTFDSLPHSPQMAASLAIFRTTHKESYKHCFWLTVVFPVIFSLVAVVLSIIFY